MKTAFLYLFLIISLNTLAQESSCLLSGEIANLSYPTTVYLKSFNTIIDSAKTETGLFQFKVSVKSNTLTFCVIEVNYNGLQIEDDITHPIFIDTGTTFIKINKPSEKTREIQINGPKLVMDYEYKLLKPVQKFNSLIAGFRNQYNLAKKSHNTDTLISQQKVIENVKLCLEVPRKYIRENKSSILSIQALKMMGTGDPTIPYPTKLNKRKELQSLFDSLSETVKNSAAGKDYIEQLTKMN